MSKPLSPYRSLTAERRLALMTHALANHKGTRAIYIQRLVSRGGGFRAVTLQGWSSDRLAKEVIRLNAQSAQDELDLLQLLYVDMEPQYQVTFLDAASVRHEKGVIPEDMAAPYADTIGVAQGAAAVLAAHGDAGRHYLRTLVVYNLHAWPGLDSELAKGELSTSESAS